MKQVKAVAFCSRFSAQDIYLFREGSHTRLYSLFGAHRAAGQAGYQFAVWAPNAQSVSVIGDFNEWTPGRDILACRDDSSGIWEGFVDAAQAGECYKFHIAGADGFVAEKADPFAFHARNTTTQRIATVVSGLPLERWAVDGRASRRQRARRCAFSLRGASGVVAAGCR